MMRLDNQMNAAAMQTAIARQDAMTAKTPNLDNDRAQIKKLSKDFEAVFLEIVLKNMRNSVPKSELIDGGNGEDIFRSMLDQQYAQSMADQSTSGIAASIEKQLLSVMDGQAKGMAAMAGKQVYAQPGLQSVAKQAKIEDVGQQDSKTAAP